MKTKQNVILLIIPVLLLFFASCSKDNRRIKGQGPIVQQSYELNPISGVALSIDAAVYITKGDSQQVMIEGQQNIINNIEKYVSTDGIWHIGYHNPVKNHAGVVIRITTPNFDYATISGSGFVETKNQFNGSDHVYINISGSGSISMAVDANVVESIISGSGQVSLSGSAFEHHLNISGSGNVRALDLETNKTYVHISGSGNSEVHVIEYLDVNISGSGNVYYKGTPQINANISGSGGIINWN
ncbi:MAG: head GIN domain-containing protein [Bacteroidales bacterium]